MYAPTPHGFAYHQYLRDVLAANQSAAPFFMATEADFRKGNRIHFPYRSYFYAFGLLHDGHRRIRIGTQEFTMQKQSLTMVGPGIVRCWLEDDWEVKNTTFFFTADFFTPPFYNNFLIDYPFFQPGAQHVLSLSDNQYARANEFITGLYQHQRNQRITAGLLFAFLEYINRIYPDFIEEKAGNNRHHHTVRQFHQLLNVHYQEHKDVHFYADKLGVSDKHLSAILKRETGLTTKQHIDDFTLFEAKSLLKQTAMRIKEIVYWLGYDDPSHFIKQFKNKTGITPSEYRERTD